MAYLNENFLKLKAGYLFPEIARRVKAFVDQSGGSVDGLIRCGIGDVTEPLPSVVREAMHKAVDEMGKRETFRGYGPEQGYEFLRSAIAEGDYRSRGIQISPDEIFVSDGSKCDTANFLDILGGTNRIAMMDPVYPVYVDTNVMNGNAGDAGVDGRFGNLVYLNCNPENGFCPELPKEKVDVIYLCYPNNPTGTVASRSQLERWVSYARGCGAIILFDAAYAAYVSDPDVPRSIFEIDGARECAVEFQSFSKNGGFTGTRCAFTVVPKSLEFTTRAGERHSVSALWSRRQSTKFNGVSYIIQRAAESLYTTDGRRQVAELIEHYMGNAAILCDGARKAGLTVFGGTNAPYIWVRNPDGISSWTVFDRILHEARVVVTPGVGFGLQGEGYFRISAFNSRANAEEVAERLQRMTW
jgi:LL-diaminopimelate aminotransferase